MKSKETKRKEALDRAIKNLQRYQKGIWNPSRKDDQKDTTLAAKILQTKRLISHLETMIG